LAPRADLLGIGRLAGQRLATERDRAWRKPYAAHSDHAASAHRAPVRVVVVGGPQIPTHQARSRIDSTRATVSAFDSRTPGVKRPRAVKFVDQKQRALAAVVGTAALHRHAAALARLVLCLG
jgi:hypothetical protein